MRYKIKNDNRYSLKEIKQKTPDKPLSYYPFWRRWMAKLSFYGVYAVVNVLKLREPTILSSAMIILAYISIVFICFNNIYLNIFGILLLWLSYYLDLIDGKVARLLNKTDKNNKWIGKFLDWNYHIPTISILFFVLGIKYYLFSHNMIVLIISGILMFLHIYKTYLSLLFLIWQNEVLDYNDKDFEKRLEANYKTYIERYSLYYIYKYFIRYFMDSTDLIFTVTIILVLSWIFSFDLIKYYLIFQFSIHIFTFCSSFYNKFKHIAKFRK